MFVLLQKEGHQCMKLCKKDCSKKKLTTTEKNTQKEFYQ